MFKRFSSSELSALSLLKTSKARAVRNLIIEQFPAFAATLDDEIPKKSDVFEAKATVNDVHVTFVIVNKKVLFFRVREGPLIPTMQLLHKYPDMMTRVQADKGAIPFLLSGANCMAPGLTSPGGLLPDNIAAETPVLIMIEGKQHAIAVGILKSSSEQIRKVNKGVAIELLHFIGDGLFKIANNIGK
jgi:PUA domain protein